MKNKIRTLLIDLGLSSADSFSEFYPKIRDYDGISVLKCSKSGVLLLSRTDHLDEEYYVTQKGYSYWASNRTEAIAKVTMEDTNRRYNQFNYLIRNKKWLDVGTGPGDILEKMGSLANKVIAVEPQTDVRNNLKEMKWDVYPFVKDVPESDFDIATVFLVLQQLFDPITELKNIKNKLIPGGKIIVEVNNANDFLFSQLNLESFKSYAFQKSVLMFHTRISLKTFLETAGFKNIIIQGVQRYPLSNHLYWLSKGEPGGHNIWSHLRNPELDSAYLNLLSSLDQTDTLIAIAEV